MSEVLVSLHGNRLDVDPRLVIIDTDTGAARAAPFALPPGFQRYMGLAVDGRWVHVLAVTHDDRTSLVTVDRSEEIWVGLSPLPGVRDGHSMLVVDDALYAVSSGTDELVRFPLSDGRPQAGRTAWRASDAGRDTHHINSVLRLDNGNVVVSAFGETPTGARSDARDGYIFDVTGDRPLAKGIAHPHSVTERNGLLYYCESGRGRFCSEKDILSTFDGYVRGVCWLSDELVCVGTSAGRAADRKRHYEADDCAVWIVDVNEGAVVGHVPMKQFGPEIYDIVLL